MRRTHKSHGKACEAVSQVEVDVIDLHFRRAAAKGGVRAGGLGGRTRPRPSILSDQHWFEIGAVWDRQKGCNHRLPMA